MNYRSRISGRENAFKVILLSSILRSNPRRLPLSSFLTWLILNSKLFLKNIATPLWLDAN
jgi:hypothetical protein